MNDFTKEELIILFLELNITIRNWGDAKEYKEYPKLKDKIQSMINNYNSINMTHRELREAMDFNNE